MTKPRANSRRVTLLLAALFALLGCVGSPYAATAVARPQAGIVWVDESRPRSQAETPERKNPPEFIPAPASASGYDGPAFPSQPIERALFQRPPPRLPSIGY